ncbi:subclass B3 metallo-beta-lactamase [Novosphingobium sp. Leaf2]|uniref:subclass B3 metallo-beta-lactamase n=1 Tax=Novosphingobium sp. Leaf2 TaxID=1735670 RepID=UPI0006F5A846|nr:subclass B3 metallo-beta-lactamase [Novosphingobium sp. Leaf2]KQM19011.1 subclass B3 metallo-beta-lactamase [Novosphingobium sp. Leaf2]
MKSSAARSLLALLAFWTFGAAPPMPDPLTRPIAPELAPRWLEPQVPMRIHGGTWLVGTVHMNVVLIDTGAGLVLIDAGLPQAAPLIEANLRAAGFDISDVKLILSSEPHYDHAGGIAALAWDSGAAVWATRAGAKVLRAGRSGADDPQQATLFAFPAVRRVHIARDGETLRMGNTAIVAHATPGHTPGSASWSWTSCEGADCAQIVFAASLNSLTDGVYRWSDPVHAGAIPAFRRSFATVRALPCDILITGHPEHSDGEAKRARFLADPQDNAFRVPGACRTLADRYERALDERLAAERAPPR